MFSFSPLEISSYYFLASNFLLASLLWYTITFVLSLCYFVFNLRGFDYNVLRDRLEWAPCGWRSLNLVYGWDWFEKDTVSENLNADNLSLDSFRVLYKADPCRGEKKGSAGELDSSKKLKAKTDKECLCQSCHTKDFCISPEWVCFLIYTTLSSLLNTGNFIISIKIIYQGILNHF